ncbi:MAG: hypothetical protein Q9220_002189 [cf. Caloplaca sp. 1 TL-2023]
MISPAIEPPALILVTGVNGYVGSHIALELLKRGYHVRGTVRSQDKGEYMRAAFTEERHGIPKESRFETAIVPEMSQEGTFDSVLQGCTAVIHTASDLSLNPDPNQVIPMVVNGVRNLLDAAARMSSIQRFVYTSSSAACTAPITNKRFHVNTDTWNDADVEAAWAPPPYTSERRLPVYAASKTLAEKECWRFAAEAKPHFTINTVLPNCCIGKILSKEQPASTGGWYRDLWRGDEAAEKLLREGFPPQHWVNVTDVAILHVAALEQEDVQGERLLAFAGPFNWNDTVVCLERIHAEEHEKAKQGSGYMVNGGGRPRKWPRHPEPVERDLKTVDTTRGEELLRRYGWDGWAGLEVCLREAVGLC